MSSGLFNVGSYQVAGHPYMTGSTIAPGQTQAFFFPAVTKRLQVQITDVSGTVGAVRVSVGDPSAPNTGPLVQSGNHFWTVYQTAAIRAPLDMNVKTKAIYITGQTGPCSYQLIAELTNISATEMYNLTGSGINTP